MATRNSGTGWTRKESKSGAKFVEISRKDAGLPAGMNPWICDDTTSIDAVIAILNDVRKDAPARKTATAAAAAPTANAAVDVLVAAGFTREQAAVILAGKSGPAKRNGTAKLSVVAVATDDDDDSV